MNHIDNYLLLIIFPILDIDECLQKPCGDIHSCHNTLGSYTCDCLAGYQIQDSSNGPTCIGKLCDVLIHKNVVHILILLIVTG